MRALRRRQHGISPAAIAVVAMLAGCGADSTISPSPTTPAPGIQPNACTILSDDDVTSAFTAPTVSPAATPGSITHDYAVESVSGKTVGQCTWTSQSGAQIIAQVIPNAELTKLSAYTSGAVQVGPAYVQEGDGRGFVSIQDGSAVLAITLVLDVDAATRTAHLADLARVASGVAVPSLSPGAIPTAAATASGGASGPGQVVQNQTASATLKETDQLTFDPTSATIQAGQVLEWTNGSSVAHNVTFDDYSSITSDTMNSGDTFEVKFLTPGTYMFHCTFHPGMNGQVTVK